MQKLLAFALAVGVHGFASGQSPFPAPSTLNLSLKTLSKALAGCRASYIRVQDGTNAPLVKVIVGDDNYQKDMTSLTHAERFVNTMALHPERVTGKGLVATLSTTDDFFAGVGSTRLAILASTISERRAGAKTPSENELIAASTSLADCQTALFNAGDDFVELVMNYVGAEDDALAARASKAQPKPKR